MKRKLIALLAVAGIAVSLGACSSDNSSAPSSSSSTAASESASPSKSADAMESESPSDPDVVGINEIEVGNSGPQTDGPLEVNVVYFQAIDLEQGSAMMPPASESDMHFEIDVKTNEKAKEWGYDADQFLPYLTIHAVVKDQKTGKETDLGTMMPMIASDGPHYGNNIKLAPGTYDVTITIDSPADQFMLHTGKDSSGVKGRFWTEPLKFEFKNWDWDGQIL